jgi:hypothetical protein
MSLYTPRLPGSHQTATTIVDDGVGLQCGPRACLPSFPSNQGFDADPYDGAAISEHMQLTTWENVDRGLFLPPRHSTNIQQTFSIKSDLGTLYNDGSTTLDFSAFSASPEKTDTAARAFHVHPSEQPVSTQHLLVEDLRIIETPHSYSQMISPSIATNDSSNQFKTLPLRNPCPNTEDWEFYRPIFTQLYRDQNRTLKEVKSIMKDIYGFNAS